MLKPSATKAQASADLERMRQEFLGRGGEEQKHDAGVAQGLRKTKYIKRGKATGHAVPKLG